VAKGASNSGVIGAMRRTPERGGGRALLPVVLLLVELASPRLVGAVTDAADGTFTLHSFLLPLGFVPFRSVRLLLVPEFQHDLRVRFRSARCSDRARV
jgi:hypothetical protein